MDFIVVMFAFLFVDMFDTLGTLIGCAAKADLLDEEGKLPGIKGALLSDAIGTMCGACLGTSTITTFVESASGIAEGGRTGLTAIASGALFLLALFFSPLFLTIPSFATAPALVMVGFLMMQQVSKIEWDNILEAIPAFICIFAMAFMYSISEGICFGIISYTVLNVASGKAKQVTPLMCSATGVVRLARIALEANPTAETPLRDLDPLTAKDVFDYAKTGDEFSLSVIDTVGKMLGEAIAHITCVVDPDVIVIGGGVSRAGQILLDAVEKYYKPAAFHASRDTDFKLAVLGNDAGMYGAVRMILSK